MPYIFKLFMAASLLYRPSKKIKVHICNINRPHPWLPFGLGEYLPNTHEIDVKEVRPNRDNRQSEIRTITASTIKLDSISDSARRLNF